MGLPEGVVDKVMKRIVLKAVTGGWRRLPYDTLHQI